MYTQPYTQKLGRRIPNPKYKSLILKLCMRDSYLGLGILRPSFLGFRAGYSIWKPISFRFNERRYFLGKIAAAQKQNFLAKEFPVTPVT